jgi:hypothetical protein
VHATRISPKCSLPLTPCGDSCFEAYHVFANAPGQTKQIQRLHSLCHWLATTSEEHNMLHQRREGQHFSRDSKPGQLCSGAVTERHSFGVYILMGQRKGICSCHSQLRWLSNDFSIAKDWEKKKKRQHPTTRLKLALLCSHKLRTSSFQE